jgi:hypothetical protein
MMHLDRSHCNCSSVPVKFTAGSARARKFSADTPENGKTRRIYVPATKYIERPIQSVRGDMENILATPRWNVASSHYQP